MIYEHLNKAPKASLQDRYLADDVFQRRLDVISAIIVVDRGSP